MKSEGRLIALDIGMRRTGIAVTDAMQIIASPIQGVQTNELLDVLKKLTAEETCAGIVVGQPLDLKGRPSEVAAFIDQFVAKLQKEFIGLNIYREDERFTSRMASQSLVQSGVPKKKRQDKLRVDSTSAAIILQSYLEREKRN